MSVTRLGVSLLNVVATIEKPASHHGTVRPETKNAEVFLPARFPKSSDGAKHTTRVMAMTAQSSVVRCIAASIRAQRPTHRSASTFSRSSHYVGVHVTSVTDDL